IRFGDNDTLAALVANLIEAEKLVLLTDQQGLYQGDPSLHKEAELVAEISSGDPRLDRWAGEGGALGRGGMITKVQAARIAARSGADTHILQGTEPEALLRLARAESLGTLLRADREMMASRKRWLATLPSKGRLKLDQGAVRVLCEEGSSLLPVGVRSLSGIFTRGDLVSCVDEADREIARGLINYSSDETARLLGRPSQEIESVLSYRGEDELIHRDNLFLL
ncbi:MAG: glutamate 5-kinase, partial [Gammaproteobacteria bacterium]|nr:glutamate 5-kinase [Gammaproteobacteria bacterium]